MAARRERYTPSDIGPTPLDWDDPYLKDVSSLITNGFVGTATPYYTDESGVTYLYGTNVRADRIDYRNLRYITEEFHQAQSKTALREGDLLTVQPGHIGTTAVVTKDLDDANCHALIVTRLNRDVVDPEFLSLYLNSEIGKARMRGLRVGSTILHINTKDLKKFRIPVPPMSEQWKIRRMISTWNMGIQKLEDLIVNSHGQKKALMQQLLTGKRRLPGFNAKWREEKISDVSDRIQRKAGDGDYPVLMISSTVGFLRQNQKYSRYMAGKSVDNYILLKKGEFAYNKGNSKTYEFGCVFPLEEYQEGLVPHIYVCIKLAEECDHDYYKYLFEFDYLKRQLGRVVNTGVRNNGLLNIRPGEFLKAKLPVPPIDEQKAIAAVIGAADAEIENFKSQLAALKQQTKALMQQLLTGKRRVKVDKEAA